MAYNKTLQSITLLSLFFFLPPFWSFNLLSSNKVTLFDHGYYHKEKTRVMYAPQTQLEGVHVCQWVAGGEAPGSTTSTNGEIFGRHLLQDCGALDSWFNLHKCSKECTICLSVFFFACIMLSACFFGWYFRAIYNASMSSGDSSIFSPSLFLFFF